MTQHESSKAALDPDHKFRALFEHAPYGILLWDPATGFYEDANPEAIAILGYSADEFRALQPRQLSKPVQLDGRTPFEHGLEQQRDLLAGRLPRAAWIYIAKDSREVICDVRLSLMTIGDRQVISNSFIDITESHAAARVLRQQASIIENMDEAALVIANNGIIEFANEAAVKQFQYPREELVGHTAAKLLAGPEGYAEKRNRLRLELERKGKLVFEDVTRRKDGTEVDVEVSATPLTDSQGTIIARIFITRDISERVRAQERLNILTRAMEQSEEGIYVRDVRTPDRPIVFCNAAFEELSGKKKAEILGPGYPMRMSPREQSRSSELRTRLDSNETLEGVMLVLHEDGRELALEHRRSLIKDDTGETAHIVVFCNDVTQRLKDEEILQRSAIVLAKMADGMVIIDSSGVILETNDAYCKIVGCRRDELIGNKLSALGIKSDAFINKPGGRDLFWSQLSSSGFVRYDAKMTRRDGTHVDCDVSASALYMGDGEPRSPVAVLLLRDVTDAKARRETLERQAIVLDQMSDGVVVFARDGRIVEANRAYCRMLHRTRDEIIGRDLIALGIGNPDGYSERRAQLWAELDTNKVMSIDVNLPQPDGTFLICQTTAKALCDKDGAVIGSVALVHDVTDLRAKESQLRQAQKMESVGQLTGGIAHDFNNLLAIIQINLDLIRETLPGSIHPGHRLLDKAGRASQNAAKLISQLLAFSRRQNLTPEATNADKLIAEMADLVSRTLPASISFRHIRKSSLWECQLDQAQFSAALLNLINNARDAMPDGGTLVVETDNIKLTDEYAAHDGAVPPGDYVRVAISDTGMGISEKDLSRVFDPFFTTKEVGAGTGLGLSMVYGFVRQSGGQITIYSEPGEGTTLSMYFPRLTHIASVDSKTGLHIAVAPAPRQKILLVEDNDDLRDAVEGMLLSLEYAVVTAPTGPDGIAALEDHPDVDLLLTDVMLKGGMNGPTLARQAVALKPDLIVVYVTGYTANAAIHAGRLDPGIRMIHKPFSRETLRTTIAQALTAAAV